MSTLLGYCLDKGQGPLWPGRVSLWRVAGQEELAMASGLRGQGVRTGVVMSKEIR